MGCRVNGTCAAGDRQGGEARGTVAVATGRARQGMGVAEGWEKRRDRGRGRHGSLACNPLRALN